MPANVLHTITGFFLQLHTFFLALAISPISLIIPNNIQTCSETQIFSDFVNDFGLIFSVIVTFFFSSKNNPLKKGDHKCQHHSLPLLRFLKRNCVLVIKTQHAQSRAVVLSLPNDATLRTLPQVVVTPNHKVIFVLNSSL